ncbi:hypothetical protein SE27_07265 [Acinetobacter harbinensis]|uniref:hypothetical protein n=1 Tax=Acinetobacter TaxID=469 RepID=UPI00057F1C87|nr:MULTISPECIES: hypothetical protein [Acinetobacter]KWQ05073.1 hypothetical protein SE27_07265 [Acinetobacter harbinensis]MBR5557150.1 hypothetical protein [Acinetobacter sp.]
MTRTFDGLNFDFPPTAAQIVELAHQHRRNLDEAVFHQDIHLGNFCLLQRKRVYDFTRDLDKQQRKDFYGVYNGELLRIADDDELHPQDAERGVGVFAIVLVLAIIALVLYFAVIKNIVG